MSLPIFNVEEENFICIFDTETRTKLIKGIAAARNEFDDPELRAVADKVLHTLDGISDAEYDGIIFSPAYFDDESEG